IGVNHCDRTEPRTNRAEGLRGPRSSAVRGSQDCATDSHRGSRVGIGKGYAPEPVERATGPARPGVAAVLGPQDCAVLSHYGSGTGIREEDRIERVRGNAPGLRFPRVTLAPSPQDRAPVSNGSPGTGIGEGYSKKCARRAARVWGPGGPVVGCLQDRAAGAD